MVLTVMVVHAANALPSAWPVVSKLAEDSDTEDVVLIYCDVGDRTTYALPQTHFLKL